MTGKLLIGVSMTAACIAFACFKALSECGWHVLMLGLVGAACSIACALILYSTTDVPQEKP